MTNTERKCAVEGDAVDPCPVLARAIEFQSREGKGLRFVQLIDLATWLPTRSFVTVRSGEFVKQGIVLNFCPFCGTDISTHTDSVLAVEEGELQ